MTDNVMSDTDEFPAWGALLEAARSRPSFSSVEVDVAGLSHQGLVRPNNEDRYLVLRAGRYLHPLMTNLEEGCLPKQFGETVHGMIVADGLGGMEAGEVASRLAITGMLEQLLCTPDWIFRNDGPWMVEIVRRIERRFRIIHESLLEEARKDPRLEGMGTTLTMALSLGPVALVAHVGDSRAYLFRRGGLRQLTLDHTLAQAMVQSGALAPAEAAAHPGRHMLTQAMGTTGVAPQPQVEHVALEDADRLLLCTDGLSEMVDDATIALELAQQPSAEKACQALVDRALAQGGKDNVSVIVASYHVAGGS